MDPIGLPIASSVAGADQARERVRDKKKTEEPARPSSRQVADSVDLPVTHAEEAEGVRTVKGNDQQESHEDRTEHDHYRAGAARDDEPRRPSLDVEG